MTNLGKYLIALALVLGLFGTAAFFGMTPFLQVNQTVQQAATNFGSVVEQDTPWFTNGYKVGPNSNALFNSGSMTIANGQDQAEWQNQTGQDVVIDTDHLALTGTSSTALASSTFQFSVGATSTATVPDPGKLGWITSPNTPLSITNFTIATSTSVANKVGGRPTLIVADNYAYHASSTQPYTSAFVEVPPGWYLFVKIDSGCAFTGAGINCELATSTNRGFTTVSNSFWYHYSSPN